MFLLEKLTSLLPKRAQPYAKAVYPAVITIAGDGYSWAQTGTFDKAEVRTAIAGALVALLTWGVPNRRRP